MRILPFLPDNDTLANAVLNAQRGDSAIVGRFRDQGGEVIVFTDMQAANAYNNYVGLNEVSSFVHVREVEDESGITFEVPVSIPYGRR